MLCYKDMTFCGSDCINSSCPRFISQQVEQESLTWTKTFGAHATEGLLAVSDFSSRCGGYTKGDTRDDT